MRIFFHCFIRVHIQAHFSITFSSQTMMLDSRYKTEVQSEKRLLKELMINNDRNLYFWKLVPSTQD